MFWLKQQSPDISIGALYPAPESNRHGFPQVFETSASTNSASWAYSAQLVYHPDSYRGRQLGLLLRVDLSPQKRDANVFKLSLIRNRYFCLK